MELYTEMPNCKNWPGGKGAIRCITYGFDIATESGGIACSDIWTATACNKRCMKLERESTYMYVRIILCNDSHKPEIFGA